MPRLPGLRNGLPLGRAVRQADRAVPRRDGAARARPAAAKSHDWFHKYILFGLFPYPDKLRKSLVPARIAQRLGLEWLLVQTGLWRLLPSRLGRMATLLPRLEKPAPPLPAFLPAKGRRRARVALFTGCVGDALFRQTNWATARVLQENGCDVVVPRKPGLLRGDPLPRRSQRAGPRNGRRQRRRPSMPAASMRSSSTSPAAGRC